MRVGAIVHDEGLRCTLAEVASRAHAEVAAEQRPTVTAVPVPVPAEGPAVDTDTGEVIDGELEPEGGWDTPAA